jgi:hypothetical protein
MRLLLTLLFSVSALGATTTAGPFKLNFFLQEKDAKVTAVLTQSCRYEKFVFSDSSEYNTEWKDFPLRVKESKRSSGRDITISLDSKKEMSVNGMFKPNKGCSSNIEVTISSTKYSIGWANRFDKAISFELRTKNYYKPDYTSLNISLLREKLENKELSFFMKHFSNQTNTFLYFDGERDWDVFATTAARDSETGMPYLLKR